MVNYNATNVALYNLGGSGDNMIADGYVRAVEKVWIDSYVFSTASAALLTTADTLCIGIIPANKKIVGCEVILPTSFAPTTCAINVGPSYNTSLLISNSTCYAPGTNSTITANPWKVTINNVNGQNFVTTSSTSSVSGGTILTYTNHPIFLSLSVAMTTPTAGTIQTILRYT